MTAACDFPPQSRSRESDQTKKSVTKARRLRRRGLIPTNSRRRTIMLGDKIGDSTGKVTVRRVLPNPGGVPRVETSFEATSKVLGVAATETGTYSSGLRPDGSVYGEGQGILMGKQGEMATWVGQGVGTIGKDGTVRYRGAVYYQTATPAWSRLNTVAAVFEYEVDAQGNTRSELWEWK
jgi:hypothetical protein